MIGKRPDWEDVQLRMRRKHNFAEKQRGKKSGHRLWISAFEAVCFASGFCSGHCTRREGNPQLYHHLINSFPSLVHSKYVRSELFNPTPRQFAPRGNSECQHFQNRNCINCSFAKTRNFVFKNIYEYLRVATSTIRNRNRNRIKRPSVAV